MKTLPPAQLDDTVTGLIGGLLNWQEKISKVQGKRVKTVGNPANNQTEELMNGLRRMPPEELEKLTRELVIGLVQWDENTRKVLQAKGNVDEAEPKD